MRLPGNLRSTTLGDLLGELHRDACSGTLELVEDRGPFSGRSHRVHLKQGLVESVDTEFKVPRLGEILLTEGLLGRQAIERALLELGHASEARMGEVLLKDNALSSDALAAALRYQLRRRLDSLFALRDALVRFRVPRPRPFGELRIPLSPREFLFGRPRLRRRTGPERKTCDGPRDRHRQQALSLLGLSEPASEMQIRRAFRRLAHRTHPDRHPGADGTQKRALLERFAELSAAYHALVG